MRVGFLQLRPTFGNIARNLNRVDVRLSELDADLIVLPELFNTGYFFSDRKQLRELAEEVPQGRTTQLLKGLSRKRSMAIVAGIAEKDGSRIYNTALFVKPNGRVQTYRKIHLFHWEKRWFHPGNLPLELVSFRGARIGMMICFDWIFPETARTLALLGADIICHPSNLVLTYCQKAMVTRSIENGVFTITANRVGTETQDGEEVTFTGESQITSPKGRILIHAPPDKENLGVADISVEEARDKLFTPTNHVIRDRRRSFYRL